MKPNYLLLVLSFLLIGITATAQQGISYKAIIHDGSGDALPNTPVTVQFTILENGTTNVYQETHSEITDANGILIVNIGEGSPISGDFNTIDWGSNPHFLKTEINSGEGLTDMGTTEFKAVPYALYAKDGAGAHELDDLADAKYAGSSLYIGQDAGINDNTTDNYSTAIGTGALSNNTTGTANTATGYRALENNTDAHDNTAIGFWALRFNNDGYGNTATGYQALLSNTSGDDNTANGKMSLNSNTIGYENTAIGAYTLQNNTEGYRNTANGFEALYNNSTGNRNTAYGVSALYSNTTGYLNTALGYRALRYNSEGWANTATGIRAMEQNISGNYNTATGIDALGSNTEGSFNSAFGQGALMNNDGGSQNIAIGYYALSDLTSGNNNTVIGYHAEVPNSTGSNQIRIGNTSSTYAGIQVAWTYTSDIIWKEDIRSLPYGLDMLLKLKPVDYIRKNNEKLTREMGIIAQDLEEVLDEMGYEDQGFLIKDDNGLLHLRYNDFTALLIKSIQDQQAIIEEQNSKIENQKTEIEYFTSELEKNQEEQQRMNKRLTQIEQLLNTTQL